MTVYHAREYKSSKEQLKEELDQMYREYTDPEEISKQRLLRNREQLVKDNKQDYGL